MQELGLAENDERARKICEIMERCEGKRRVEERAGFRCFRQEEKNSVFPLKDLFK